jgi:hypothetical protein
LCRHILAIVLNLDESIADVRWRAALGFYFGKPMFARLTSVIMQALESSLKKVKDCIQTQDTSYPVYSEGTKEFFFLPFSREGSNSVFSPSPSIYFISLHGRHVASRGWIYLHPM